MDKWQEKSAWASIRNRESEDLSELESTAYYLFGRSRDLTSHMSIYTSLTKNGNRDIMMRSKIESYVTAFDAFALAVARDTRMTEEERWHVIKLTILNEEQRRMTPISCLEVEDKMVFEELDLDFADDLTDGLDAKPLTDTETLDKLNIIFTDMTENDIDLFKQVMQL